MFGRKPYILSHNMKPTIAIPRRHTIQPLSLPSTRRWVLTIRIFNFLLLLGAFLRIQQSCALSPSVSQSRRSSNRCRGDISKGSTFSPLFARDSTRTRIRNGQTSRTQPTSTAIPMVLTTPEAVIERASTVNLLDDLIDESVRTSARRPIMMQFDPSAGMVGYSILLFFFL